MRMVAVSTLMHKHAADRPSPSWAPVTETTPPKGLLITREHARRLSRRVGCHSLSACHKALLVDAKAGVDVIGLDHWAGPWRTSRVDSRNALAAVSRSLNRERVRGFLSSCERSPCPGAERRVFVAGL